ncbi:arsenite efflux transporter metallochaperone ArsD [Saccharococcus caldoxylosilyticus]|uniref:arsenite efflux transporter metallochaperone ArsD n=1 Tax=Saccharococcus caldoxylosilyticus TaxID=81408 RepID=UPI0002F8E372|nr:arsenite efflux transporter metallochaperone ArsD [Parageobacillus caldoxylosilyticus]
MRKIEIFDPAMCCPTGICGPSIDPELIRISIAVNNLKSKGIDIVRYNLGSEPDAFVANEIIRKLLTEKGPDVLPIVLVDGEVIKEKGYPTNAELAELTGMTEEELSQKPKVRLSLNVKK